MLIQRVGVDEGTVTVLFAFTVTVAVDELVSGHTPLCTTALYRVVTVRLVAV